MEAIVVGALTSLTVGAGMILWYLMVNPELMLSLFDDEAATGDGFFARRPGTLQVLQWTVGVALVLLAFLTGLATAFLGLTTYY